MVRKKKLKKIFKRIIILSLICLIFSLLVSYIVYTTRTSGVYDPKYYEPKDYKRQEWLEKKIKKKSIQ